MSMRLRNNTPGFLFFLSIVLMQLGGCTKLDYIGEEYPPTSNVEMYFSEADVTREHKVMGHLIATADDIVSAEKMQKKMMQKAMEKGADAIIILGMEKYQSGETTNYSETTVEGTTKKGNPKSTTTATSTTTTEEKKQIKAILIKFQ